MNDTFHVVHRQRQPHASHRRALAALVAAVAFTSAMLAAMTPAGAHGSGGADSTNFLTTVTDAGATGLEWEVQGGDALLQLTNKTGGEVVVAGYETEPYLRFVPGEGVYENTRSPATYLNQSRYATAVLPPEADADAPPIWRRVTGANTHSWHDHRAHWMSPVRPPIVEGSPDEEHLILSWQIPVTLATGQTVTASGTLRWIPPIPWWPALLIIGVLFATVAGAAAIVTRPQDDRWPGLSRPVAALLALVVAANAVRTVDDMVTATASTGQQITLGILAAVSIGVILGLGSRAWRGGPGGFGALIGAGLATFMIYGGEASAQLSASQIVTSLPFWVRRWTVASSYAIVVPVAIAAVVAATHFSRYLERNPDRLRHRLAEVTPDQPGRDRSTHGWSEDDSA